jgi:hypothetical protein
MPKKIRLWCTYANTQQGSGKGNHGLRSFVALKNGQKPENVGEAKASKYSRPAPQEKMKESKRKHTPIGRLCSELRSQLFSCCTDLDGQNVQPEFADEE